MSVQVRRRREAASFLSSFVGAQGELIVDTTNNRLQVHDGATPGGWPTARLTDVVGRTAVADASYAALAGDRTIAFTSLSAPRTVTLPAASTFPTGTALTIVDESGACSAASPVTVARAGTDTINGATAYAIAGAYGYVALESNGAGKWTIVDAPAGGSTGALRYDLAQALTAAQQAQAVANLGGLLAGFRNRLVNGAMRIDQRNSGAAQTIAAGAALAYTVDRFYAFATGAAVSGQQVAVAGLTRYQLTGASGVTAIGFGQRIEAANSADLAGTTVMLGVTLANSLLTSVAWAAYYAASTDGFGSLASPTRTQIAAGTFTVGATPARCVAPIALPAAAATGLEIVLSVGAQSSGTWTIGDMQLEPGTVATSFERRPLAAEYALATYYFQLLQGVTVQVPAAGNMSTPFYFRTMRTVPVQSNVSGPNTSNLSSAAFVPSSVNMGYTQLVATAASGYANGWNIALNAEL